MSREMVYDDDDDWADSLGDEEWSDAAVPPLDLYNDAHIQALRITLHDQLGKYIRANRQGYFYDATLHERWLGHRPELAGFIKWYQSADGKRARALTMNERDLVLEHYLFHRAIASNFGRIAHCAGKTGQ